VSENYPKHYGNDAACEISMGKTTYISMKGSTEKWFDTLTVSGKKYSGKLTGRVEVKGNVKWSADFFEATKGWKICKAKKPSIKLGLAKQKRKK